MNLASNEGGATPHRLLFGRARRCVVLGVVALGLAGAFLVTWLQHVAAERAFDEVVAWTHALRARCDLLRAERSRLGTDDFLEVPHRLEALRGMADAADVRMAGPIHTPGNVLIVDAWQRVANEAIEAIQAATANPERGPGDAAAIRKSLDSLLAVMDQVLWTAYDAFGHRAARVQEATLPLNVLAGLAGSVALALSVVGLLRRRRTRTATRVRQSDDGADGTFRSMLSQVPHPHLLLEPISLEVLYANPAACRHLGLQAQQLLGRPFAEAVGVQGPRLAPPIKETGSVLVRLKRGDGSPLDTILATAPIRQGRRLMLWANLQALTGEGVRRTLDASDSRFGLLAESIPGAAFLLMRRKDEWVTAYMSRAIQRLTGASAESFTRGRRELEECVHPDDRLRVREAVAAAMESCSAYFVTYRMIHLDGSLRWVEEYGQGVAGEDGVARHAQGTIFDVTQRYAVQAALAAEQDRLRFTLRSMADAVVGTNADGRVEFVNEAAERLSGLNAEGLRGKSFEEAFPLRIPGIGVHAEGKGREGCAGSGSEGDTQRVLLTVPTRGERTLTIAGASIRGHHDEALGAVFLLRDVTDSLRREEEMLRAAKLESVGVLAGGIAHDFNNILAGIIGNLSLARMDLTDGSEAAYSTKQALDAAVRAQDLTRQLLTFAKGGAPMKRLAVLDRCIRDTTAFALRGSTVRCEPTIEPDLPAANVDENQIQQVLHNLVLNATQAMPQGGALSVDARGVDVQRGDGLPVEPGRYVAISVRDTGCGIEEAALSRIFDPYFTTKEEGTGLGLATSYSIVKKHGGAIVVSSKVGEGTEFRVYLPASDRRGASPEETMAALENARKGTGRILVMDDEPSVRDVCGRMLQSLGYRPSLAEDGTQALELYAHAMGKKSPFDLVLMDLTVPGGMGGREASRRLLELDPLATIIVSSGYSDDPAASDPTEHGFAGSLSKPYMQEDLARMLFRHLGRAARPQRAHLVQPDEAVR